LRDPKNADLFNNEWESLKVLQQSNAPGADTFTSLIPQPIMKGEATGGTNASKRVNVFRRPIGFKHTLEEVRKVYPQGIPPRASVWIWRRILEVLAFIHGSGMVHVGIVPSNLLIQENEHGILIVGYSCAGRQGEKLRKISSRFESFYPRHTLSSLKLTAQADLAMSARCIVAVLGGNPATAALPNSVPQKLATVIQRIALIDAGDRIHEDAWTIREELGKIAEDVFGTPQFIPIVMPS
jgi:serine/threonine protein kinase